MCFIILCIDESSSEEEIEPMSAVETAVVRRQMKGKMVEGVNGIYEGECSMAGSNRYNKSTTNSTNDE